MPDRDVPEPDLPVAAPDPAETIRRVTEPAAQEYGWAWIDQPWQDYMDDVAGDKRAASLVTADPVAANTATRVAALYVETGGVYYGLEDVDPWDEERDARWYLGPWPVVAHPPCEAWSLFAPVRAAKWGRPVGEDGGCFEAALSAVRTFGGVLEHPRLSRAWDRFGLVRPSNRGWAATLDGEWIAEVDQAAYGHPLHKPTWLLYVGDDPIALDDSEPPARTFHSVTSAWRKPTPLAFRDVLLDMARSASKVTA